MTIQSDNWCPTCEEACHDHATICTVCGSALQAPPAPRSSSSTTPSAVRPLPSELTLDLPQANQELASVMASLRTQMQSIRANATEALNNNPLQQQEEWQQVPVEALDPQAARPKSRPVAKAVLEQIPRIVLESKSALLHQAILELTVPSGEESSTVKRFIALLGEFGPSPPHLFRDAALVMAKPKTAKGGLSSETQNALKRPDRRRTILYVERGDGVTFCKKALIAQEAGASAVIIGNNTQTPWPYVMKDSKNEAASGGLIIPVVMVKESDGRELTKLCLEHNKNEDLQCALDISANTNDCVVCREAFETSQKVMRLPACGHVFHEGCSLSWLNHHNTCPYCRREMPTDDEEYEQERRRIQRTHAGSQGTGNGNWQDLHG